MSRRVWRLGPALVALAMTTPVLAAEETVPTEWQTRAEASGFAATSSYDETISFIKRLQVRMPDLSLSFYGTSAQGRPLPMVVLSRERAFRPRRALEDRKSTRLNSSHLGISYAVFCLKKKQESVEPPSRCEGQSLGNWLGPGECRGKNRASPHRARRGRR